MRWLRAKGQTLEWFRKTQVYKAAVQVGLIQNDEWAGDRRSLPPKAAVNGSWGAVNSEDRNRKAGTAPHPATGCTALATCRRYH